MAIIWSRSCSFARLRLLGSRLRALWYPDLALLDLLASQIRAQEARIQAANIADADTALIASIPGMGPILLSPIPGFPAFMLTDPLRLSKTFGFVDSMA